MPVQQQAVVEFQYPIIASRAAAKVTTYMPPANTFVERDMIVLTSQVGWKEKDKYRAAIMAVADYALHMSIDTTGEKVTWRTVDGTTFLRHRANMLSMGWKLHGSHIVHFQEHHWDYAFGWLKRTGYLFTLAEGGFERNFTYKPSAELVRVFARTLA